MVEKIDKRFYLEIGKILHLKRMERGYSLRYMAELTGISRTTIDKYELGVARIDINRFKEICKCLQVNDDFDIQVSLKNNSNLYNIK